MTPRAGGDDLLGVDRAGAVVVGVSPTTGSPAALRWAAREARLRTVPLRAVMAWRPPRPPAAPGGRPPSATTITSADEPEAEARAQLGEFLTSALGPQADVTATVVRGTAVKALLTAAEGAELLVIGEPRPGRLGSVRSSLVAPQLVLRAGCPVVVMPATIVPV